ncbi:MAG: FprA family A-type flavoprotein [Acidobacteriota bacterium]
MKPLELKKGVHWVGALDPDLRVFDVIMKSERGTTYSSYLLRGLNGTALIDSVKAKFAFEHLERIKELIEIKALDYIILNHTEPDHSGALSLLIDEAPQAKVVISKNAPHFLKNLMNRDIYPLKVGDGDYIDLGGRRLEFISAPFLHWPDTMFTYSVQDRILFPCDFLGCHFCDERMYNDLVDDFSFAFQYYFDHIMRPFREHAQRAIERISALNIDMIAPSHGPILRHDIQSYLSRYREWIEREPQVTRKILVFYASAYGNTARMAREIAGGVREGGAQVTLFDVAGIDMSKVPDLVEEADGIIVGSPTINGDAVKAIWDLLSSLATIKLKGKIGGAFGSYGWSGEAIDMIDRRLKDLKFRVPLAPVKAALTPTEEDLKGSKKLGFELTKFLSRKS